MTVIVHIKVMCIGVMGFHTVCSQWRHPPTGFSQHHRYCSLLAPSTTNAMTLWKLRVMGRLCGDWIFTRHNEPRTTSLNDQWVDTRREYRLRSKPLLKKNYLLIKYLIRLYQAPQIQVYSYQACWKTAIVTTLIMTMISQFPNVARSHNHASCWNVICNRQQEVKFHHEHKNPCEMSLLF